MVICYDGGREIGWTEGCGNSTVGWDKIGCLPRG
jgi:hypothetical protein